MAAFPLWRLTNEGLLGLSAEWGRTFANWHVTDEEVDAAIELCKDEWNRVPENVTKAFRELLNKAIARCKAKNEPVHTIYPKSPESELADARAGCCKRIKNKHYANQPWDMPLACEIGTMLTSLEKTARQENPKASDIEILRMVWALI